jgi:hypothetical protein
MARLVTLFGAVLASATTLVLAGAVTAACGSSDESEFGNKTDQDADPFGGDGSFGEGGPGTLPDGAPCTGLCLQQVDCGGGADTTLSGTVYDPAGNVPLYNVVVYVPNAPVDPITTGATCDKCGSTLSGSPVTATLTDAAGKFKLPRVPVGNDIPLVIQVGKWRRQVKIPSVAKCIDTPLTDKNVTRLPRNSKEGDIPLIALTTGGADTLECLLGKNKIGLDDSEFATKGGTGRVHLYGGYGDKPTKKFTNAMNGGATFADAQGMWSSAAELKKYDIVLLSCEGTIASATKPQAALDAMRDYLNAGGRVFASHWHHYWFSHGPAPIPTIGTWSPGGSGDAVNARTDPQDPATGTIDTSFPKGAAFRDWMVNVQGSTTPGQVSIKEARHNLDAVTATKAQQWITLPNQNDNNVTAVEYVSFNTPVDTAADQQCGRAVYSDLHVSAGDKNGPDYPSGCTTSGLSPQEKALEFMLFDLSSCISDDKKQPPPPIK